MPWLWAPFDVTKDPPPTCNTLHLCHKARIICISVTRLICSMWGSLYQEAHKLNFKVTSFFVWKHRVFVSAVSLVSQDDRLARNIIPEKGGGLRILACLESWACKGSPSRLQGSRYGNILDQHDRVQDTLPLSLCFMPLVKFVQTSVKSNLHQATEQ